MRTWIKNGARMTILVTAFAGAGAGVAYSSTAGRSLAASDGAGHAVVHLVSMRLAAGCSDSGCSGPLSTDVGAQTGYTGGPLASYGTVSPAAAFVTRGEDQDDASFPALGKDAPEESTSPANMPASEELPGSVNAADIPAGEGSTGSSGGHHPGGPGTGPGTGHHHHHGGGAGAGKGKGHHGKGAGKGKGHHGSGAGGKGGSGAGGSGSKSGQHMTGGHGASTGAKLAGSSAASGSDAAADATAAANSSTSAAPQSSLPTTGAPLAGLLGLAVVALGAGVFFRLRRRGGDEEEQPQES